MAAPGHRQSAPRGVPETAGETSYRPAYVLFQSANVLDNVLGRGVVLFAEFVVENCVESFVHCIVVHVVSVFEGNRDPADFVEAVSVEEALRADPACLGGATVSREEELFAFVEWQRVKMYDGDV